MGIESATTFMGGMVFGAAIVGAVWGYAYASRKEQEAWAEYRRARADANQAKIDAAVEPLRAIADVFKSSDHQ